MRHVAKRVWWALLIGGMASVLFGILALAWPGITALLLAAFFAASVLVDGVFNTIGALRNRGRDGWWLVLLVGLLGIVVGGYGLSAPESAALALLLLMAAYAIVAGALLVVTGVKLRREIRGEWLLVLAGVLSVVFGIALVAQPAAGLLSLVWLVGAWALATGALRILLAFTLRSAPDAAAA